MSTVLLDKKARAAESYRSPMPVIYFKQYRDASYYICPRCSITMEREFMAYCDRCGQCLSWKNYRKAVAAK